MPLLLSAQNLAKSFSGRRLFSGITLGLYDGERIGMFGPNGAGKSTFLKILAGHELPDEGSLEARRGIRVGYLPQEDRFEKATPEEELVHALRHDHAGHLEEHEKHTRAAIILTKIGFGLDGAPPMDAPLRTLSGGWRKRAALARELVLQPDLLLLDEPTNHLDLEGIEWLERFLNSGAAGGSGGGLGAGFAFLVVTHDRYFLENVTTRVIEINPLFAGGFLSVAGNYDQFLERRQVVLEAQAKEQQSLSERVKEEIAWLRRGPKAQRTKNKSRIKDAHALISTLAETRQRTANDQSVDIEFSATERKTKKLIAAHNLVKSLGGGGDGPEKRLLIDKLSITLSPGMKLGVLGPNGSGKSTLLKLLTGQLAPDSGTVKNAHDLRIVFFDQQRQQLERRQLLKHALSPDSDSVVYNGELLHVSAYAKRFLFRYEQLDRPVGELSGGEQARVLIARLMLTRADVLVLDEPTNDLDIPSLEVLEASLEEFPGALVLVTHDRFMLDRLATDIIGLNGRGNWGLFTDYLQYENWRNRAEPAPAESPAKPAIATPETPAPPATKTGLKRLTLKEQKEWSTIEADIHAAEARVLALQQQAESPALAADHVRLTAAYAELSRAQQHVHTLYERWQQLDTKLHS
ncbi:MAG TPA: ABC-F family ATP-binding cassette domain-containing protein [Phycisphaerae bacterium]|nr:ABC-F family ATP-binding cassette domain-containing protein [Phycisphaerae bacterium]